ncbi:MAG: hypothetical protein IH595_07530 [Bacteroidales bacterium]|nr:hypothetical protein [Bacteroidales bacterium]
MYAVILNIHIWTSALFMLVSIVLTVLLFRGTFSRNIIYTRNYVYLENSFIILLYLGLILGVTLYLMMPANRYQMQSATEVGHIMSLRFWSVEHFSVMLFAVILAQIGKIFTSKSRSDHNKFKYALIYYGFATLITLTSMTFYMIYKG